MKKNGLFFKPRNLNYLKYLLTYLVILTLSFLAFFYAVNYELKSVYFASLEKQNERQLNNLKANLEAQFVELNQIHNALSSHNSLVTWRYNPNTQSRYAASKQIKEYTLHNTLIEGILYIDRTGQDSFSTSQYLLCIDDGIYSFLDFQKEQIDPDDFYDPVNRQIRIITRGQKSLILYIPAAPSQEYQFVYVLQNLQLKSILASSMSAGISSICLTDIEKNIIIGIDPEIILPYIDEEVDYPQNNLLDASGNDMLYSTDLILNAFRITALYNYDFLLDSVTNAFRTSYIILMGVGILGLLITLINMRIIYSPLDRLVKKVVGETAPTSNYINELSTAFDNTLSENQVLSNKVHQYRIMIQKSILDSLISSTNMITAEKQSLEMDAFFSDDRNNHIYVAYIRYGLNKKISVDTITSYILKALPTDSTCFLLEEQNDYSVFLINYTGYENMKDEVLYALLLDFYELTGCKTCISQSSSSPMQIPTLYENVILASAQLNSNPVLFFGEVEDQIPKDISMSYPYKRMEDLEKAMKHQDFPQTRTIIRSLFRMLLDVPRPDFFTRCVLLDMLTLIVDSMNHQNIKFKGYSELYFETLYYCRSCKFEEKNGEIIGHFERIIDFYEEAVRDATIQKSEIESVFMKNYCSSDFSITFLADHFHVSIAYMSYLFKKFFSKNFSDYLWELRLEKAQRLLLQTERPIDEISEAVGYQNASSFRRKFKQEMGVTPSGYRKGGGVIRTDEK